MTSWWTGSPQQFNINEIIYSDESVLPGSWCWSFWISNRCRSTDMPRRGSFVVLALTSMRLIQAKPGDCCIHKAWQELLWRSLARILMLLRLFLWRTGCGRMNGSDFGWKCRWKSGKIYGIPEKSVLRCTKKHHTNGLYSVEANYFVNGNPFI